MSAPRGIFVLHTGGLGDLVLASGFLAALRAARPAARITLATRAGVAPLVAVTPLRETVDAVVPLPLDPYRWAAPSEALFAGLEGVFAAMAPRPAATFISAELRPTWLTFVLAARLRPRDAVTLRSVDYSRQLVAAVCDRFGMAVPGFRRYADGRSKAHELVRYQRLAKALGVASPDPPRWPQPAKARAILKTFGLAPYSYVACFPGGASSTPGKRWPPERFVAVLESVRERLGGRVLLVGEDTERDLLEDLRRRCAAVGLEPHVFAGAIEGFRTLRALVANAWGYVGNDTGTAHLAAVHGVPGVTIYGGGTWPMYAPWSPGSVGVVHPMPCFGCFWDCAFGRAVCVEQVSPESVASALVAAVSDPAAPARHVALAGFVAESLDLIRDAAVTYRAAQKDRAARLEALLSLARNSASIKGC